MLGNRGIRTVGFGAILVVAVSFTGCAGPEPSARPGSQGSSDEAPSRTLVIAFRYESQNLAAKVPDAIGTGAKVLFNAALTGKDHGSIDRPVLAEALPQLNTDTWRVFPDGTMETIHQLRPRLTWHDGQALIADDFVFAWRVYADPGLGVFPPSPQNMMEEVHAPDSRSIVIRWRKLHADADILDSRFPPLPRHVLAEAFSAYGQDPGARERFLNHPFWTTEYVGLGPFRLERWEPGIALYGVAFPGYALGGPKIDRIIARAIADQNTVLTNVLAGEVQLAAPQSIEYDQAMVLKRTWEHTNQGVALINPTGTSTHAVVQHRPEYQKTPALFDLRVRKALMHSIDKQALLDGLFEGQGVIAHTSINPTEPWFPQVDRVITKYDYDPRKTEALMNEAGFFKDGQGFFVDATGARFRLDFQVLAGTVFERHQAIQADTWARAGIETGPSVLTNALSRDPMNRHTFPGLGGSQSGGAVAYTGAQIGTAQNNWNGSNRGGWSSPDYEALWDVFNATLVRSEGIRLQVEMAKMVTEQLPAFMLYFTMTSMAYSAVVRGPEAKNPWWSAHEWELR